MCSKRSDSNITWSLWRGMVRITCWISSSRINPSIPQRSWRPCCRLWLRIWPSTDPCLTGHHCARPYESLGLVFVSTDQEDQPCRVRIQTSSYHSVFVTSRRCRVICQADRGRGDHNIGRGRSPTNAISTTTKGSHQMALGRGCGGETKLERQWKSSKSEADRYAYRRACRRANKLINASRWDNFRSQLSIATDCKERWKIAKEVLHSTRSVHERSTDELKQLCLKFAVYFVDKICSLKASIAATLARLNFTTFSDRVYFGEPFESVANVSVNLITSMPSKSSSVDFIPTSLLKLCPSVFSEIIARLANLSFSDGIFPTMFKSAAVTPLLKKPSLDPDNPANYRPISNLNNISKIIERLFRSRFYPHVTSSPNFNHLQSAYRPHHSTETALLQTFNDIFCSADSSQPTLLVSLDLSAAFDTIDHSTLLSRLSTSFGVSGAALAWLTSYLTNRAQTVHIGSVSSEPSICLSGVPRGSVLVPILFSLYIPPIGQIVSDFGISHQ